MCEFYWKRMLGILLNISLLCAYNFITSHKNTLTKIDML